MLRWASLFVLVLLFFLWALHHSATSRQTICTIKLDSQPSALSVVSNAGQPRLRIVIALAITPIRAFHEYQSLADCLAGALGVEAETIQCNSYKAIHTLLRQKEADVAFIGDGGYLSELDALDVLAAPVIGGKMEYCALIIVPERSPARQFSDLRGKDFLFVEEESLTGCWYPCRRATELQSLPDKFFGATKFTGGHDLSVLAVSSGLADGASVSNMVYERLLAHDPSLAKNTRILERSESFSSPPVVVRKSMPENDRKRLLQVLINLPETGTGRQLLGGLGVDKYVPVHNADYARLELLKAGQRADGATGQHQ